MSLIEMLTGISLFCGSADNTSIPLEIEKCRKAVWKCIDKERNNIAADIKHRMPKEPIDPRIIANMFPDPSFEKCFR